MLYMSSVLNLVLSYCKNDYLKAEKEMDKLRNKALELQTDSESEDSDYVPDPSEESEDEYVDDEVVEEHITIIRHKSGHYRLK
jgi:hypothetical protein